MILNEGFHSLYPLNDLIYSKLGKLHKKTSSSITSSRSPSLTDTDQLGKLPSTTGEQSPLSQQTEGMNPKGYSLAIN
jgi:hypothetical protein